MTTTSVLMARERKRIQRSRCRAGHLTGYDDQLTGHAAQSALWETGRDAPLQALDRGQHLLGIEALIALGGDLDRHPVTLSDLLDAHAADAELGLASGTPLSVRAAALHAQRKN
jgi:hypothetical protein